MIKMNAKILGVLVLAFIVGFLLFYHLTLFLTSEKANVYFAAFFRDVSRYNSRRRLFGKEKSLVQFLIDKNFELKLKEVYDESDSMTMTMTPLQLAEMDGRTEDTPVYVALAGRIYDVSSKREAYGPGKNYNCFVGRDASLHYATGCTDIKCPGDPNNLNEDEQRALNKWLEFYHNHDKYRYVGRLIPDPVETVLEREFPDNHQHGSSEEISSMQEVIESKEEL